MKKFDIPEFYKSSIISKIKERRRLDDPRKKDFTPTKLNFGAVQFNVARHFGFCYGVENAIEIAYKAIEENPGKRIFLLSEMIHNPGVNADLLNRGIKFILSTYGEQLIDWNEITSEDVVIIPAFGTTLEVEKLLIDKGVDTVKYNTTCPFVEKVWNRSAIIGKEKYSIVIHGKAIHEETRATFSHASINAPSIIVRDINEAEFLCKAIAKEINEEEFYTFFEGKLSKGFSFENDLKKIGVVNQTTMLASETEEIANCLKSAMLKKYGEENLKEHFADTKDTLCYATNDNQTATIALMNEPADFAIVIGGYNSSNTSHLVELLEQKLTTFFISGANKIISSNQILHFDPHTHSEKSSNNFIPDKEQVTIAVTSGASCPDSVVDEVLNKILSLFPNINNTNQIFS